MENPAGYLNAEEYLDLLSTVLTAVNGVYGVNGDGPRMHPEDIGVSVSLANDAIIATLGWVMRNGRST